MNRCVLFLSTLSLLFSSTALVAQQPSAPTTSPRSIRLSTSPSEVSPSVHPDVWLYLHEMQRYEDPQNAVRRNAERRAEERRDRIAARHWMGYSPARPVVSPTPYTSSYGVYWPTFFAGSYWVHPYYWLNASPVAPVVHVSEAPVLRQ